MALRQVKRNDDVPDPVSRVTGSSGNTTAGSLITVSGGSPRLIHSCRAPWPPAIAPWPRRRPPDASWPRLWLPPRRPVRLLCFLLPAPCVHLDPGAVPVALTTTPLTDALTNKALRDYDNLVKDAFDRIVPVLKRIAAVQHEPAFIEQAQRMARSELGFELPLPLLETAWVSQLDMRTLFAWCVFRPMSSPVRPSLIRIR
jgi:hypothetical protein